MYYVSFHNSFVFSSNNLISWVIVCQILVWCKCHRLNSYFFSRFRSWFFSLFHILNIILQIIVSLKESLNIFLDRLKINFFIIRIVIKHSFFNSKLLIHFHICALNNSLSPLIKTSISFIFQ